MKRPGRKGLLLVLVTLLVILHIITVVSLWAAILMNGDLWKKRKMQRKKRQ